LGIEGGSRGSGGSRGNRGSRGNGESRGNGGKWEVKVKYGTVKNHWEVLRYTIGSLSNNRKT
jgi:hypothetical protein